MDKMTSTSTTSYGNLPTEVQCRIVRFCNARTRLRLAMTNRKSRSLVAYIETGIQHVNVQENFNFIDFVRFTDVLRYLTERYTSLLSLDLSGLMATLQSSDLRLLFSQIPKLESLSLAQKSGLPRLHPRVFDAIELFAVNIRSLNLDNIPLKVRQYDSKELTLPSAEFFQQLTNFSMQSTKNKQLLRFLSIVNQEKCHLNLCNLRVSYGRSISRSNARLLATTIRKCKKSLEIITLSDLKFERESSALDVISAILSCTHLHTVHLHNCWIHQLHSAVDHRLNSLIPSTLHTWSAIDCDPFFDQCVKTMALKSTRYMTQNLYGEGVILMKV